MAITVSVPIVVRVQDSLGGPLTSLPVYAFDGSTYTGYNGTTNASGQVTLTLPLGNYRFRADRTGTQYWSGSSNHCTIPGCVSATITIPVTSGHMGGVKVLAAPRLSALQIATQAAGTITTTTVISYTYDPLNRLTDATYSDGQRFQYAYDEVGNRMAQTATITSTQTTAYQYDAANRLSNVNGQAYSWDDNGNLVNDGNTAYAYDQANRLVSATLGVTTTLYAYNGDGARLKQTVVGTVTIFTQDLVAPLPVVLQSKTGANAMQYVYALGTRPLAQYRTAGEYLLADVLGSVRQIADAAGNITLAKSYEPYGTVLNSTGTASSIFGYSGEQVDTSGLVYLRARYMQPMLGIFLARDPWSGNQMRPGSMNGYLYVDGDPINGVDPSAWCTNCTFGTLARVNESSGANLRAGPHTNTQLLQTLSFDTKVFVLSPYTYGGGDYQWRMIGVPWNSRSTVGFVADQYIDKICDVWTPNCPPHDPGPQPGPGPDLNFDFKFTDLPIDPGYAWAPFGPSQYAYCNAGIPATDQDTQKHPECTGYFSGSNPYWDLHGLHNGIDLGTTANTTVKWTVNQVGIVQHIDSEYPDATPNVVVETGNYWVIFGHTNHADCIKDSTVLNPNDTVGTIADQGSNTHLHLGIVPRNDTTYFLNPASAFPNPNYWTDYAAGYGSIKGFRAGSDGSFWDGTYKPDY